MSVVQALFATYSSATLANVTYVFSTSGTFSNTTPTGYNRITVEAIGGGGNGFGSTTVNQRASGGGGGYAITPGLTVTGGTTVIRILVGALAGNSWVNIASNAAPTSTAQGSLGVRGTSGASATAGVGGGQAGNPGQIGSTTFAGASGTTGTNSAGGGGAGFDGAATGATAGTDTSGLSPTLLMGDGTGGVYNNATTGPGTAPGGGGGGSATAGTNYAGAVGRVRITYWVA